MKRLKKLVKRQNKGQSITDGVKPITNQNLKEQREKILDSGRKYKYPVSRSKRRLVTISASILLLAVIGFFSFSSLALYKYKNDSKFMYQITKVFPFPVARIGSDFVAYEDYLFEIQRYKHYYSTQQEVNFSTESAQLQLAEFKKTALKQVVNDAYVSKLADEKNVSVSDEEINQALDIYKSQNRLGDNDDQLKTVLGGFYGWSINDFRVSLKKQLLREKLVAELDQDALAKANQALETINGGAKFEDVAKSFSEDPSSAENGGDFGFLIDKDSRDVSPKIVEVLDKIQKDEVSGLINVGYGIEIVKNLGKEKGKTKAAHILINFQQIDSFLGEIKDRISSRQYVNF